MAVTFQVYPQVSIQLLPEHVLNFIHTLDIYYQPEYLSCDARMQHGTFEMAVCTKGEDVWVYPYIKVPIPESTYFDLISPYGYAGPCSTNSELNNTAEELFLAHVHETQNIVTEFVRYHPIYNEHEFFQKDIKNVLNRKIILTPTVNTDSIWQNEFSGTNRNLVRKMEKEGYSWNIHTFTDSDVSAFDEAYRTNMLHTGASDFYFFDVAYYEALIAQLGDKIKIVKVEKEGVTYASALFFISGGIVTYYLSARNLSYPKVPASNLLLSNVALWSQQNGYQKLNLGGGLSLDENDYLFKFKSNFGKLIRDFTIGKRVHQPLLYAELKDKYIAEHGLESYEAKAAILQFYR